MMLSQVQGSRFKGFERQFITVLLCALANVLTCFCGFLTSEPLNQICLVDGTKIDIVIA